LVTGGSSWPPRGTPKPTPGSADRVLAAKAATNHHDTIILNQTSGTAPKAINPTQSCTTTNDMPTYVKNYLRQTHRITAPARQAVQALQKPLASGGPRGPGRSLGSGCLPGPRELREPTAPPDSRVFGDSRDRRFPHGNGGPRSSPLANSDQRGLPSQPRVGSRQTGRYSGSEGRGHVSDTEGLAQWAASMLPTWPGSTDKGWQGSRVAGQWIPGIDPGILHPAALGTSAVPPS
jgi:hypothetical protein